VSLGNNTSTNVLSIVPGSVNLGSTGTTSTVQVRISENPNTVTEVAFTDVDPPVVVTPPVSVTNPVSSVTTAGGPGVTIASSIGLATSVAATIPALVTSKTGALTPVSVAKLTAAQRKAFLKSDEKTLSNVNASITRWSKTVAHTKGAAHRAALHRLSVLRSERSHLLVQIKGLKK